MATIDDTQASNRLSERLRSGLALAQTRIHTMESRAKNQWTDLPVQLREMLDRAVARLRTTLDLPSRSDVSDLVDRLEALDRKIVALEKRQGKRAAGPETASRAGTTEARDQEEADVEKPAPVKAAASAEPTVSQRADAAEADAKAAKASAKADDKTTTRKTVKPTSAAKTVTASKAGSKAARATTPRGGTSGQGQARGPKKRNRR
jgi:hypothetical protein